MPIERNNVKPVSLAQRNRHYGGLFQMHRLAASLLYDEQSAPYPPASQPGEYPRRRTGQLVENITFGVDRSKLEGYIGYLGRAGVGPYFPHRRAGGYHWKYLEAIGRLGPADVIIRNRTLLIQAYKQAIARRGRQ